jgi:hypothetical protein
MESGTFGPPRDTARAMSEENIEIVRQSMEALLRRDRDAWLAIHDEDFANPVGRAPGCSSPARRLGALTDSDFEQQKAKILGS